ncbi:hypothetical protein C2845_PM12G12520 [Panicum miliaceum]|uniref:Uncharacterized protein n=1 Tax=Panicum miliaceum TaxID=4540 RepID=A0A3L6QGF4_PANMI|nr:hypothetical protein C2845_PM12G12520 [Panicum miliaceum]
MAAEELSERDLRRLLSRVSMPPCTCFPFQPLRFSLHKDLSDTNTYRGLLVTVTKIKQSDLQPLLRALEGYIEVVWENSHAEWVHRPS